MKRLAISLFALITGIVITLQWLGPAAADILAKPGPAPEFTHTHDDDWINSAPLLLSDLRGKVVLVDFWTFDCWNCYRSFPWLKALERRLEPKGLQVIGVHSPEFDHEKVKKNVIAKIDEFGLHHPIMIDNDFSYWRALGNRFWPAYFVIDKQNSVRGVFYGETHEGDQNAERIEELITALLNE
ncbi:MAG: redoxin family protein [Gammaproteobacteria bacterium]